MSDIYEGSTADWTDEERKQLTTIQEKGVIKVEITERDRFRDVLIEMTFPDGGMTQAAAPSRTQVLPLAVSAATAWANASGQRPEPSDD